jgi:hypothetical protein
MVAQLGQPENYKLNQDIAGTQVYISLLSASTSILFSSRLKHAASILNSLEIK